MGWVSLVLAIVQLLCPNVMWRMHAWGKEAEGLRTERTEAWDANRKFGGVLLLILGVVMVLAGESRKASPDRARARSPDILSGHVIAPEVESLLVAQAATQQVRKSEDDVIEVLRNVISAQAMLRASGRIDTNGNHLGEYGGILEMAGIVQGRLLRVTQIPGFPEFEFDRETGVALRKGYCYRIFLPNHQGTGVAEPPLGYLEALVDAEHAERGWCCYAWPIEPGVTGHRTFFANQAGELLATTAKGYEGPRGGPQADAAYLSAGSILGPFRGPEGSPPAVATDGNRWDPVP